MGVKQEQIARDALLVHDFHQVTNMKGTAEVHDQDNEENRETRKRRESENGAKQEEKRGAREITDEVHQHNLLTIPSSGPLGKKSRNQSILKEGPSTETKTGGTAIESHRAVRRTNRITGEKGRDERKTVSS